MSIPEKLIVRLQDHVTAVESIAKSKAVPNGTTRQEWNYLASDLRQAIAGLSLSAAPEPEGELLLPSHRLDEISAFPVHGHDWAADIAIPNVLIGKHDLDELVRGYRELSRRLQAGTVGASFEWREDDYGRERQALHFGPFYIGCVFEISKNGPWRAWLHLDGEGDRIGKDNWGSADAARAALIEAAKAALSITPEASPSPAVPEGYVLVPKEHKTTISTKNGYHSPSCSCGWKGGCWSGYKNALDEVLAHEVWAKTILATPFNAAAPKAPAVQEGVREALTEERARSIVADAYACIFNNGDRRADQIRRGANISFPANVAIFAVRNAYDAALKGETP